MSLLLDSLIRKVKIDPDPRVYFRICEEYRKETEFSQVIHYGLEGLTADSQHLPLLLAVGRAFQETGKFDNAIEHYQKALQVDPGNIRASYGLAFSFMKLGLHGEAEPFLETLKLFQPSLLEELDNLAIEAYRPDSGPDGGADRTEDVSKPPTVTEDTPELHSVDVPDTVQEDADGSIIEPNEGEDGSISDPETRSPRRDKLNRLKDYLEKIRR